MADGLYQSLICFYMAYLLFADAVFVTASGQDADRERMGIYVACPAVFVVNAYVLLNTYRWDWLIMVLVAFSILLVWFWTGVWSAFTSSESFYQAAPQVLQQLTFWAVTLLTVIVCLLPRFTVKAFQKIYLPRDIDIVREQVRQGKFGYLDQYEAYVPPGKVSSATSSDLSNPIQPHRSANMADDERPIYPPSVAQTSTTRNPRSQTGSDETNYTSHRHSLERPSRISLERPRPSFDRARASMDRVRPSYEASNDFTSAALLTRLESSHSYRNTRRIEDISSDLR